MSAVGEMTMIAREYQAHSGVKRRAVFSPCEKYRYELSIVWDDSQPRLACLLMNPSTATEMVNDPTIERCERRALMGKFGGLEVLNVFAWRETNSKLLPGLLANGTDLVGPGNEETILRVARAAGMVICAWGNHGNLGGRGDRVRALLDAAGVPLYVLKLNGNGNPGHLLYIGYDIAPRPWK